MSQSHIQLLQRMPVFQGIRDDTLRLLLEQTPVVTVKAGDYFFRQGEQAFYMYALESGSATVLKLWQGQEHEISDLVAGECFGEVALIDLAPRSASVRANSDCSAIEISAVHLNCLLEADAQQFIAVQANLARELCRRLRVADESRNPSTASPPNSLADELTWPQILSV